MIDLHSHTNASDGTYSPKDLVIKAVDLGLKALAITDHDTVAGLEEGIETAKNYDIELIPGIEINIEWPTGEFHLLGLGLKHISSELTDLINFLKNDRHNRNEYIIQKMQEDGINCTLADIEEIAQGATIGRPHFADFLVKIKKARHRQQAFDLYLGRGRPYYVCHKGANLDEAIVAINSCGGVPVIAHPLSLYISWGKIQDALEDIFQRGVVGLEAWHPGARIVDCKRLEEMARNIGFFITAGSDFHGEKVRADRKLGYTSGSKKIEDKYWFEELKPNI